MGATQTPKITAISSFPEHYMLENLVVRTDGSILVVASPQRQVWYVPAPEKAPLLPVTPLLLHTFPENHLAQCFVEAEPDIFYVATYGIPTLWRFDLREWKPGQALTPKKIFEFEAGAGPNGGGLIAPGVMVFSDCVLGLIWRVDLAEDGMSAQAKVWSQDPTMAAGGGDGYARLNGLAALVVTNGVGALSAINGIAGSFCEHLPVICICGSLPRFAEVTIAQAQLDPGSAASEIDRLITTAWRRKRPVYLELPSDIAYLEVEVPENPLVLEMPMSDPERLQACAQAISSRIQNATAPALLLDMDAERFDIKEELRALAERIQSPVATMGGSKTAFEESHPLSLGIYQGAGNKPEVRTAIEKSDCLLTVGYRRIDSTSGFFTSVIPESAIHLRDFSVEIGSNNFQGVTLKDVVTTVTSLVSKAGVRTLDNSRPKAAPVRSAQPLQQKEYWPLLQEFLRPGDVLLAEDGTSSSGASSLQLPPGCTFITQAVWGSIGYTLGSLLGTLFASPERRHLLFIGDGSF